MLQLVDVALPAAAREDLAWSDSVVFPAQVGAIVFRFTCPGDFYFLPRIARAILNTDATVINRLVLLSFFDSDGNNTFQVPPTAVQAATTAAAYNYAASVSSAYGPISGQIMLPMPSILLLPGYAVQVFVSGAGPTDTLSFVLSGIKIPSGPAQSSAFTSAAAPLELVR